PQPRADQHAERAKRCFAVRLGPRFRLTRLAFLGRDLRPEPGGIGEADVGQPGLAFNLFLWSEGGCGALRDSVSVVRRDNDLPSLIRLLPGEGCLILLEHRTWNVECRTSNRERRRLNERQ